MRVPSPRSVDGPVRRPGDELRWHHIQVQGRGASYGVGGEGPPVVFLHGWALGHHAYKRAARRLTNRGCRVYAPAMPSFARSADLPRSAMSIAGYAAWVNAFMEATGIEEPALVIGHSFGGGVAIKLAHDFPERVRYLVLVNSVGGGTGVRFGDRPPWDWVIGFARDMLPLSQGLEVLQAMRDDLLTNMVTNPLGLMRAGHLARTADLTTELSALRERKLPVLAITSEADTVIPRDAFDALCSAVGTEGRLIQGGHSWLLTDPTTFGEVLANLVEVQVAEHRTVTATTRSAQIAELLRSTSLPTRRARTLVRDASPLWLMSGPPPILAADLTLCHPRLKRREVRAVAHPIDGGDVMRLTVVAHDRPGLIADSAAVLARHGMSVAEASGGTWGRLALHAFTLQPDEAVDDATWAALGTDLETMDRAPLRSSVPFMPLGQTNVEVNGASPGQSLVRVTANDQLGLLWAICRWFADHRVSIESVHASTERNVACDTFIVTGRCDAEALAAHLSGPRSTTTTSRSSAAREDHASVTQTQ